MKDIVSSARGAAETGGLRLVAVQGAMQTNLQLSVVAVPGEDDEVIDEQGARLFLEPEAASLLDDKIPRRQLRLNQVEFTIADQLEE